MTVYVYVYPYPRVSFYPSASMCVFIPTMFVCLSIFLYLRLSIHFYLRSCSYSSTRMSMSFVDFLMVVASIYLSVYLYYR
jgi:hypothetical protein